jgi:hypothetical protein
MATSKTTKSTAKTIRSPWIAERRLERRDAVGGIVIVHIGSPEWPTGAEEWRCPFMFEGLGDETIHYGRSIDSMAALQNALTGIRQLLERTGIPLRWEGFDGEDITGFTRDVPWDFGLAFYHKIEKVIETEIEELVRPMRERHEQREAQRAARKKPKKKPT